LDHDTLDFWVDRAAWQTHRFMQDGGPPPIGDGEVLFRVDRFALTANNISYAASGDMLGYWRLFPAEAGWGRIPAMGFGDVIASRHPGVPIGTRCFGFYPMSRYLKIEPGTVSPSRVVDGAAHREGLAPVYNEYLPTTADPLYASAFEDATLLLRGLFLTSFLAEDFLADQGYFGAANVLVSSASSKTSIALAFALAQRQQIRVIGLTSARHQAFVEDTGFYDEVVTYEGLEHLSAATETVFVDMTGNAQLLQAIHQQFQGALKYTCRIGATHWEAAGDPGPLPGPRPAFFFAPRQIQKRMADWGSGGFRDRVGEGWASFRETASGWLAVRRGAGRDALTSVYDETLRGDADPARGHVISLWETPDEAPAP